MSNQPYIGLRPFERDETDIFFGRETHSDELINRLSANHFLAVIGTSGCGKSSLVKTGLIAGLEAGYLAKAGTHWRILEMRPGQQPFQALADKLFTELKAVLSPDYTAETLQQALRQGSLSLHELLAQYPLPNAAQLLIVCDQFEEIFRYFQQGESAEARNFVSLLLASSKPYPLSPISVSHSLYVVITMRSDFLGDCAQFAGLAEAINQGLYLTPRLDAQQLRTAIEEPAFVFGGEVEPALVTQLLEDAGNNPDQLPLLQHVLMRLWDLSKDKVLTLADYQRIGGLIRTGSPPKDFQSCANALSRHADEVYDALTDEQKRIAEVLFRNLTESDNGKRDTRRPIQLAEIIELTGATFAEVVAVINEFRQAGRCFLMPPINVVLNEESVIDISHESLIRQWQSLKVWADEEAEDVKNYLRLEDRALEWQKGKAGFLHSPELEIFEKWWHKKNPNEVWVKRYGKNFVLTEKFLTASLWRRFTFRNFFIWCSGANGEVLSKCPEFEHIKQRNIGAFVFLTGIIAFLASSYSLFSVFNDLFNSFICGLLWAALIFNLDRFLVSTSPLKKINGEYKFVKIFLLPRLILAGYIGFIIAIPFELYLFKDGIDTQIQSQKIKQKYQMDRKNKQLEAENSCLQKNTDTIAYLNQEITGLTKNLELEIMGIDGSMMSGCGMICFQLKKIINAKYTLLENSRKVFFICKEKLQNDINTINKKEADALKIIFNQHENGKISIAYSEKHSLLQQYRALSDLYQSELYIREMTWILTILFIFFEITPVLAKFLGGVSNYDLLLYSEKESFEETQIYSEKLNMPIQK